MNKTMVVGTAMVIVVALGLGVLVFSDTGDTTSSTSTDTVSQSDELPVNDNSASGTALAGTPEAEQNDTPELNGEEPRTLPQSYDMDMSNFAFSKAQITASPGQEVTINLTNSGGTHDFVIDELDVQSEVISSGQTTSVTFTVPSDASGSYSYYCSIGNHRAQGMEGTLVIN